jgi:hypothetical protein
VSGGRLLLGRCPVGAGVALPAVAFPTALGRAAPRVPQATWHSSKYSMQMLVPPAAALTRCWAATDALFASLPDWGAQPIDMRHPFSFYYGHVAAFSKLKMLPHEPAVGPLPPAICHPPPTDGCLAPVSSSTKETHAHARPRDPHARTLAWLLFQLGHGALLGFAAERHGCHDVSRHRP